MQEAEKLELAFVTLEVRVSNQAAIALYAKYGFVLDKTEAVQYSGLNAMKEMNAVVDGLKRLQTKELAGLKVSAIRDYSSAKRTLENGTVETLDIPKCNCVYYEFEGGSFVCVRPSGTEPFVRVMLEGQSQEVIEQKANYLAKLIEARLG